MRGKVDARLPSFVRYGITPAYAGKSYGLHKSVRPQEDHPRLCGEKIIIK